MILVEDFYKRECQFSTCHEPSKWIGKHEFTNAPDKNFCQKHADAVIQVFPESIGYWKDVDRGVNVGNSRRIRKSAGKGTK